MIRMSRVMGVSGMLLMWEEAGVATRHVPASLLRLDSMHLVGARE